MKILIVSCTKKAYELAKRIGEGLLLQAPSRREISYIVKCDALGELSEMRPLHELIGEWFPKADAIIFVCAAGIAVRSIAPYLQHKSKDPAVVVVDELGEFCIPVLSGHCGGANELAGELAELTGAIPVVTTATDREKKPAIDVFAVKNHLEITDWQLAKKVSAGLLAGKRIGIYTEEGIEIVGEIPPDLYLLTEDGGDGLERNRRKNKEIGICISSRLLQASPFAETLYMIPKRITVGIGCKKGITAEKIKNAVECCLAEEGISPKALLGAATIDLKKEEAGLLAFCREMGLSLSAFSPQELMQVEGSCSPSSFVKEITGVDNVCERSALAASGGRLICRKRIYEGVTVALAERNVFLEINI